MKLAFLGLGKMGSRMAEKLLTNGHELVVWNRSSEGITNFKLQISNKPIEGVLTIAKTVEEAVNALEGTKIVWSMLPAGDATEEMIQKVAELISPSSQPSPTDLILDPSPIRRRKESEDTLQWGEGDQGIPIIIDGGNSFYKDTELRYKQLKTKNIRFLGIGVSGGIIAEKEGYPMMVGGDQEAYDLIVPLLDSLSKPHGGHTYFGTGGAGHFVKMVHNGIEYGMMQAIGEGFGVLEKSPYDLNLLDIAKNWQHGTIVDSFLIDRAKDALEKDGKLSDIIGEIDANGEGEWTINQAKEENVPIENIQQSLDFRRRSKIDPTVRDSFAAKMVAALRNEFGGHAVKRK